MNEDYIGVKVDTDLLICPRIYLSSYEKFTNIGNADISKNDFLNEYGDTKFFLIKPENE